MTLLAYRTLGAEHPTHRAIILHGVMGRKNNWSSFARALCKRDDTLEVTLADIRLHGDSLGFAAPHTIAAAAADVVALCLAIGPFDHVLGHSLGSKIAAKAASLLQAEHRAPTSLWMLDGTPSADPDSRARSQGAGVLRMLEKLGTTFDSREAFLRQVQAVGYSAGIAQWLAMNLRSTVSGEATFALDLEGIDELLESYFETDLWPELGKLPDTKLHLVVGADSEAVPAADRDRFSSIGTMHTIVDAGHWVHVDQPAVLLTEINI